MTLIQRDRDWAHALQMAVEEHFPLPDREWREWPCVPDVEVVCAWLKRLVEEIRACEREACRQIATAVEEESVTLMKPDPKWEYLCGRRNGAALIANRISNRKGIER